MVKHLKKKSYFLFAIVFSISFLTIFLSDAANAGELLQPIIVIDAGHGGGDFGEIGVNQIREKDITLAIAKDLEELITDRKLGTVYLTRASDERISSEERIQMANSKKGSLFVSIHVNSSKFKTITGVESCYFEINPNLPTENLFHERTLNMADNTVELVKPTDFSLIPKSSELARKLHGGLVSKLSEYYSGIVDNGIKSSPLRALSGLNMPATLIAVSYIDHPEEGRRLAERRYQRVIANGIFDGLQEFILRTGK